jgi:prophage DNA circulation protein
MIFLDSRYSDGNLYKAWHAGKQEYHLTVVRTWPSYAQSFFVYEWVDGDRLDNLATRFLGDATLWWQLLDVNPEIVNPAVIKPGTQLRIPNA